MSEPWVSLVIAGSRGVDPSVEVIDAAIENLAADASGDRHDEPRIWLREVVCGCAAGADRAGERWAKARGIPLHHEPITEEDRRKGVYLGPRERNRRMAIRGTHAIIFWDGISGGSADMATRMLARHKPVVVIPTRKRAARSRQASGVSDPQATLAPEK